MPGHASNNNNNNQSPVTPTQSLPLALSFWAKTNDQIEDPEREAWIKEKASLLNKLYSSKLTYGELLIASEKDKLLPWLKETPLDYLNKFVGDKSVRFHFIQKLDGLDGVEKFIESFIRRVFEDEKTHVKIIEKLIELNPQFDLEKTINPHFEEEQSFLQTAIELYLLNFNDLAYNLIDKFDINNKLYKFHPYFSLPANEIPYFTVDNKFNRNAETINLSIFEHILMNDEFDIACNLLEECPQKIDCKNIHPGVIHHLENNLGTNKKMAAEVLKLIDQAKFNNNEATSENTKNEKRRRLGS